MADKVTLGLDLDVNSNSLRQFEKAIIDSQNKAAIQMAKSAKKAGTELFLEASKTLVKGSKDYEKFMKSSQQIQSQIFNSIHKGNYQQAQDLMRRLKIETEHHKQTYQTRKRYEDDILQRRMKSAKERVEGAGQRIDTGFGALRGGDLGGSLKRMFEQAGDAFGRKAAGRQAQARQLAATDPKAAAQMSNAAGQLAKAGKALGVAGAAIGVLAMLVAKFMELQEQAMKLNRALVDTQGALNTGLNRSAISMGRLDSYLSKIRNQFHDTNGVAEQFNTTAENLIQITNAFGEAGVTMGRLSKEIKKNEENMSSFSDATAAALTYSKLLGVSETDIASNMAKVSIESGRSLNSIQEGFSVITREAMASGMSTKRFYSTVLEVTSGMAMYNYRLEQTAELLSGLSTILGEVAGEKVLKSIAGKYGPDMSTTDALKEVLLKGQGNVAKISAREAQGTAAAFLDSLGEEMGTKFREAGLDAPEALAQKLKGMDMGEIARFGMDMDLKPEQIRQLQTVSTMMKSATGDLGAQARALREMSLGAKLALALDPGGPLKGMSMDRIAEGSPEYQAALEQMGYSAGEIRELAQLTANFRAATGTAKDIAGMTGMDRQRATEQMARQTGLYVDDTGQMRKAKFGQDGNLLMGEGEIVSDLKDFVMAEGKRREGLEKDVQTDRQIAMATASATKTLKDIMDRKIAEILNSIYVAVSDILKWMVRKDPAETSRLQKREEMVQRRQGLLSKDARLDTEIGDLMSKMDAAPQEEKFAIQQEIEKKQAERQSIRQALDQTTDVINQMEREKPAKPGEKAKATSSVALDIAEQDTWKQRKSDATTLAVGGVTGYLGKKAADWWTGAQTGLSEQEVYQALKDQLVSGGMDEVMAKMVAAQASASYQAKRAEQGGALSEMETAHFIQEAVESAMLTAAQDLDLMRARGDAGILSQFLGPIDKANDLIIPRQGRPVMINDQDTLMAFKPGGPIDQAMGQKTVNVNIYGGDLGAVYMMMRKVLSGSGYN